MLGRKGSKKGHFPGKVTKKSPIIDKAANDDAEQMGDAPPTPAKKGPTMAPAFGGPRGPRKFRRTSLTRVDHDSFMG